MSLLKRVCGSVEWMLYSLRTICRDTVNALLESGHSSRQSRRYNEVSGFNEWRDECHTQARQSCIAWRDNCKLRRAMDCVKGREKR